MRGFFYVKNYRYMNHKIDNQTLTFFEPYFDLFFQIGDGHHGTPLQRMEAARLKYELANDAQKQGYILSQQELHEIFVEQIVEVIPAPTTVK